MPDIRNRHARVTGLGQEAGRRGEAAGPGRGRGAGSGGRPRPGGGVGGSGPHCPSGRTLRFRVLHNVHACASPHCACPHLRKALPLNLHNGTRDTQFRQLGPPLCAFFGQCPPNPSSFLFYTCFSYNHSIPSKKTSCL